MPTPSLAQGEQVLLSAGIAIFIAENKIKQFAYSISQSADADSSLYQREPCNSFVLKCRFITKQFYPRELILLKIIVS